MPGPSKLAKRKWERSTKVSELLATGLTVKQILQYVNEKLGWETTEKSVFRYISAANEIFAEESKAKINEEFGKGLRRLNMLFASSLKIQDYKACLAIQREINAMLGFTGGTKSSLVVHGDINAQTNNVANNTLQLEYVGTDKMIATSEDMVDISRPDKEFIQLEQENDDDHIQSQQELRCADQQTEKQGSSGIRPDNPEPPKYDIPSIF